jgi:hypothetical protein
MATSIVLSRLRTLGDVSVSSGAPDANKYPLLDENGLLDSSFIPGGGGSLTWPLVSTDGNLSFGSTDGTAAYIDDAGNSFFAGDLTLAGKAVIGVNQQLSEINGYVGGGSGLYLTSTDSRTYFMIDPPEGGTFADFVIGMNGTFASGNCNSWGVGFYGLDESILFYTQGLGSVPGCPFILHAAAGAVTGGFSLNQFVLLPSTDGDVTPGFIGVHTSSPAYELDVNGSVNVSGSYYGSGANLDLSSNTGVFGGTTSNNLYTFFNGYGLGGLSQFSNDVGYLTSAAQPGDPISEFGNNAGYLTSAAQPGDNVSEFTNDAGYVSSGADLSIFTNDTNFVASSDGTAATLDLSSNTGTFAGTAAEATSPAAGIADGNIITTSGGAFADSGVPIKAIQTGNFSGLVQSAPNPVTQFVVPITNIGSTNYTIIISDEFPTSAYAGITRTAGSKTLYSFVVFYNTPCTGGETTSFDWTIIPW